MSFPAKYPGTCDYCQLPFVEGEPIARANRSGTKNPRDFGDGQARFVNRATALSRARDEFTGRNYALVEVIELATGKSIERIETL